MKNGVVAAGLVANVLGEGYVGAFTFHDDLGLASAVVDHDIATARHAIEGDGAFDLHQFVGVGKGVVEEEEGMLTHLFFRS